MLAFFAARGHSLDELANLSGEERLFLGCAREQYYEELAAMLDAWKGAGG